MKLTNTTPIIAGFVVVAFLLGTGIVLAPAVQARDTFTPVAAPDIEPEDSVNQNTPNVILKEQPKDGTGEEPPPDNYPSEFNVVGPLSDLRGEEIVVGEALVDMAGSVSYFDANGDALFKSYFKTGVFVGIVLNEKGEAEQIWRLKNKQE